MSICWNFEIDPSLNIDFSNILRNYLPFASSTMLRFIRNNKEYITYLIADAGCIIDVSADGVGKL